VWIEFGNGDTYVTVGAGAAATQHRDADAWFFVTIQRVGHDLELANNNTPLGRRQLEDQLTDGSVYSTADDYRTAVDQRLLGLGTRRYRQLVDLLLTLRRPHLAGKLDTEHLSATLSAGLGELESALIDDVAHSFDDLDAMQHELEGLAASLTAVELFLPVYRDHLIGIGRQRAQAIVDALTGVRNVERSIAATNDELTVAHDVIAGVTTRSAEASTDRDRLDTEIEAIQTSPAYQNATALDEVRKSAEAAVKTAHGAAATATTSATESHNADQAAADAKVRADACAAEVDAAIAEWSAAAATAGIEAASGSRDFDDHWATSVVTERRDEVRKVTRLAKQAADSSVLAQLAENHERDSFAKAQEASRELDAALRETERHLLELTGRRAEWVSRLEDVAAGLVRLAPDQLAPPVGNLWGNAGADEIAVEEAASKAIRAFHAADRVVGDIDIVAARALDAAVAAVDAQTLLIEDLDTERDRVATEPNPGPPPNPTRPDATQQHRAGAPLYVCVDFADGLDEDARAGLEAALNAAGVLDARVVPADDTNDALDAALSSSRAGNDSAPSLADVLVAVPVDGLDAQRITTVLRTIPLDNDVVEFHKDGRWRLGPLAGRFAQPRPQFIGHTARERRRVERLAALDQAIADEGVVLAARAERHAQLVAVRAELIEARIAQPPTAPLEEVLGHLRDSTGLVAEREATHATAKADAETKLKLAGAASTELHRAATQLRLPANADSLIDVEELLRDCDNHRRNIVSIRKTLAVALAAVGRAAQAAERDRARATGDRVAAEATAAHAKAENLRYEQLRANVGGDAARAVEALAEARRLRKQYGDAVQDFAVQLRELEGQVATLTERFAGLEQRQTELAGELASAEQLFRVVCSSDVADVLTVDGVEPGADPPTAARRLLASTDRESDDTINRMERAYREILLDGLRAGHDPSMPKIDGVDVVRVGTVDGDLPIGTLARQLRDEHERTGQLLTKQEREIFENHLLTRVGDALRQLLLDADAFEHRINDEMSRVPTESGMIVELRWEVTGDEPGLRDAIQSLRTAPELLGPDRREALREFFMHRIADLRSNDPGRSFAETLAAALDYRSWHNFALYARFADGKRQRVTRTFYRGLSGGEAATLLHLPLFAAAAAQYSNGTVDGPRIIALDEAFVGIDDKMRSRLMGLLTQLDLDVILTSHEFWGFYETVPTLVLYDLVRRPPTPGVYAQRIDWTSDVPASEN
jgi:uncharacterized protein (TIGR02680 family)